MTELHQLAAAIYLAAGIGALLGIALPSTGMSRGAVWGLGIGALLQGLAFGTLHNAPGTPPLTDLPTAISVMAWMAVLSLLILMWRLRLPALAAAVGPIAFLCVFTATLHTPVAAAAPPASAGAWPHAHVLLGSAGLALLGVASTAGVFFLAENRRLKSHNPMGRRVRLPTLEALDRVNVVSLGVGFLLLTLGVITGMAWLNAAVGEMWTGGRHELWTAIAWAIYAGLVVARFLGHQGGRQAAASAVGGFAFLLFAVVGVELLS